MSSPRIIAALVLAGLLMAAPEIAARNPQPMDDDLVLPMPGGSEMVFRKVHVPGRSFWGDPQRVVQLGDAQGGIFEGLQRVQVSGSFQEGDEGWHYYLGKYEVTVGQFVAVMGLEALAEASGDSRAVARLEALDGRRLDQALAKPLVFVDWHTIQSFIRRYNLWLFDPQDPQRLASLPRYGGAPGFLRLPTELEWEYAARGGEPALDAETFKDLLPFPEGALPASAWYLENAKHHVRPVGLRRPNPLGLFDMLGNAQELASGLFRPEIWQGKPGGLTARGGSVATPAKAMRSSRREEVEIYRWVADEQRVREWRSYSTGLRLAIGSNVVISPGNREDLERAYKAYHAEIRDRMPVGRTLDHPVAQAATQLGDARARLDELVDRHPGLAGALVDIERDIEQAEERLDRAQRLAALSTAQDALREATDLGRDIFKLASQREQLGKAERLAALSTRYQDLVRTLQTDIARREAYAAELLARYAEDIADLGEYADTYTRQALQRLGEKRLSRRAGRALELLADHMAAYRQTRRVAKDEWRQQFEQAFERLAD